GGFRLAPREIEILDARRFRLVAHAHGIVVVEVPPACAHAADVEREPFLHRLTARGKIGADFHRHERRDVEGYGTGAAAGARHAGAYVRGNEVEALRIEEQGQHAVGELAGERDAGRTDRRGIDRHVAPAALDALERLAEPGRAGTAVRNLV